MLSGIKFNPSVPFYRWVDHLPVGTAQTVMIDITGQGVSQAQKTIIANRIVQRSNGIIDPENIIFFTRD